MAASGRSWPVPDTPCERPTVVIVARIPRPVHAWRPLVVPFVVLLAWDIGVTVLWYAEPTRFMGLELQFSLFGSAIGLFIGFMVNAAYGRWWEARTLWGQVVNSSRTLARELLVLLDSTDPRADPELPAALIRAAVAHPHLLRAALRQQPMPPEAAKYLTPAALEHVSRATNKPNPVLTVIAGGLSHARSIGMVGELSVLQVESSLVALTDAQGGLERIKNTPLPVQYRFLPRFVSIVFSAILPFAIVEDLGWATPVGSGLVSLMFLLALQVGDELAEPFVDGIYDVPMTALCRTIEIDLVEMIGDPAPPRVTPVDQVLW